MNPGGTEEQDVFLSYAVASDYRFVRELESFLESFHRTPTLSSNLQPIEVCVDGSDFRLPSRGDWQRWAEQKGDRQASVWQIIETHLGRCKYLLVLGSASAARSPWVEDEVRWFLANRGPAAILLALSPTVGDPVEPSELFPPSVIQSDLPNRTIWFDFRGRGRGKRQASRVRDYFEERVRLAAELCGKSLGELLPGWYRNERRVARRRLLAVVAIALLALGTTAGALLWRLAAHRASVNRADAHVERAVAALRDRDTLTAEQELQAARLLNDSPLARRLLAENAEPPLRLLRSAQIGSPAVAAASDGAQRVLAAGEGGDLRIVDLETGSTEWTYDIGEPVRSSDWDAHAGRVAIGTEGGRIVVLDSEAKRSVWSADLSFPVLGLRYSPSGRYLAAGLGDDQGLAVFGADGEEVLRVDTHAGSVQGLEFNRDEDQIYWGGSSQRVWSCALDGGCQGVVAVEEWVYSIAGSSTGRFSAIASGDQVRLFDHHLQQDHVLKGHASHAYSVSFSPDERHLFSAGADGEVRVWDPRSGLLLQTVRASESEIYSAPAIGSRFLATADRTGMLQVWGLSGGDVPMPNHHFQPLPGMMALPQRNQVVEVVPSGAGLLVTTWDGERRTVALPEPRAAATGERQEVPFLRQVAEWRARSSVLPPVPLALDLMKIWGGGHPGEPDFLALRERHPVRTLSRDGARLVTVLDDGTWSIEVQDSETIRGEHEVSSPSAVAFIDATTLVIAGEGGLVQRVGISAASTLREATDQSLRVDHLLVYPDRRWVLVADGSGGLEAIDLDQGTPRFRTSSPGLTAVAFSPDGSLLAVAGLDGTIDLLDPGTGAVRASLRRHGGAVNVVGFLADGSLLVSAGFDETVRFWNAERISGLLLADGSGSW